MTKEVPVDRIVEVCSMLGCVGTVWGCRAGRAGSWHLSLACVSVVLSQFYICAWACRRARRWPLVDAPSHFRLKFSTRPLHVGPVSPYKPLKRTKFLSLKLIHELKEIINK